MRITNLPLVDPPERALLQIVARLAFANPFLSERLDAERDALGPAYADAAAGPHGQGASAAARENERRIGERLRPVLERAASRLAAGVVASDADRALYQDACLYLLHATHGPQLRALLDERSPVDAPDALFRDFAADYDRLFQVPGLCPPPPEHVFACGFQIQRAVHFLFDHMAGVSRPMARLRATVWNSIFTRDLRQYVQSQYARMDEIPTLIQGPTGTGKELVARAIGLSRYVAFDPKKRRFVAEHDADYHPLNLSALPESLIESELFGHVRGAFSGAMKDKRGWLGVCKPGGTVFLDEIGELDPAIQAKLLRVLESRTFLRIGDTQEHRFSGRVIAATHRNLRARIKEGAFREDLYQRLAAHKIATPSLREQLDDAPEERRRIVRFIAGKVAPENADALTDEVERCIDARMRPDYPWPGNVRELLQVVRGVMVDGDYLPIESRRDASDDLFRRMREGTLPEDEVLRRYTNMVHALTGSLRETARRLGIDRRTVARRIEPEMVERFRKRG